MAALSPWGWTGALVLVPVAYLPGMADWFGLPAGTVATIAVAIAALLLATGQLKQRNARHEWHLAVSVASLLLVSATIVLAHPAHAFAWILLSLHALWVAQTYGLNAWLILSYTLSALLVAISDPSAGISIFFAGMTYVTLGNYTVEQAGAEGEAAELARQLEASAFRDARLTLARDLHDGLGAHLTGATLQARVAGIAMDVDGKRAEEALRRAIILLKAGAADVSAMRATQDSAPVRWADAEEHLLHLARELTEASGAALTFVSRIPADLVLPSHVWATLRCVAQSALSNVALHSRADHVELRVSYEQGQTRLVIEDDGVGFGEARPGFGLTGIESRAMALGGSAVWGQRESSGTRFAFAVPLAGAPP